VLRRADELREEIGAWQELGARAQALAEMAELAAGEADALLSGRPTRPTRRSSLRGRCPASGGPW